MRRDGPDAEYVRISNFIYPNIAAFPGRYPTGYGVNWHVPIDDTHVWKYYVIINRVRPLRTEERTLGSDMGTDLLQLRNIHNHYLQDREAQKSRTFIGVGPSFFVHDAVATESMGPVYDRSREHLGASDRTVITVRTFMLNAVKSFKDGKEPPHIVTNPTRNTFQHLVTTSETLPTTVSPEQQLELRMNEER